MLSSMLPADLQQSFERPVRDEVAGKRRLVDAQNDPI